MADKKLLYEVSYIRPVIIFLLVLLHSFEHLPVDKNIGELPSVFMWIQLIVKGFRIETIALIAGYVFAYQSIDLSRKYDFHPFVTKKIKRLILPMLMFGSIYYFLFDYDQGSFNVYSFVMKLFTGCGHLWFLPMLFWCFVSIWIIDRYSLSSTNLLLSLAILSIVPVPDLPLGFARLNHFLFYVYGGYFLWTKRSVLLNKSQNIKSILVLWGAIYYSLHVCIM